MYFVLAIYHHVVLRKQNAGIKLLSSPYGDTSYSGSLLASHFRPTGSIPGQLSHGSRIPNIFWTNSKDIWM